MMMRKTGYLLSSILVLSVGLGPRAGAAEGDKQRAKTLLDEGNAFFAKGAWEDALLRYELAYEAYPSPKILLNMAEAHRSNGAPEKAVRNYERFLTDARDSSKDEVKKQVRDRIAELEGSIGRVSVDSPVSETQLEIDGDPVGGAPLNRYAVSPGEHELRAEAKDREPSTRSFTVSAGATVAISVEFGDVEEASSIAAVSDADPGSERPELVPSVETSPSAATDEGGLTSKWWFWAGLGAVVVTVAVVGVAASSGGDSFVPTGELGRTSTSEWERF